MPAPQRIPPRIALKIDVATYRAALVGMPHLVELLRRNRATASFAVSLGPDSSGAAVPQIFNPARHGRAANASLSAHFGFGGLLYGSFLPARQIGRACREALLSAREAGCEIGIAGWDAFDWACRAMTADVDWSHRQLAKAQATYTALLSDTPQLHAAPAWRSNPHALRLTQRLGFVYASDCRGHHPFVPVWNGEIVLCPQFPTTLPTLDELAGRGTPDFTEIRTKLLALTAQPAPWGHVFSLRAPHRPEKFDEFLEQLFAGWREQGYELTSIQTLASAFDVNKLPRHEMVVGTVPGRCGTLLMQGNEFLSDWRHAA